MSEIAVRTVESKKDMKTFVKVPYKIFADSRFWVPPLMLDEFEVFNRKKNPAYENADSRLFLAFRENECVGRIAAILSYAANRKYSTKNLRFGWFDTVKDFSVARALFAAAEKWGLEMGMETFSGPHGFTDMDPEGMLIEGFDKIPTIATIYNHSYYPEFMEKWGFAKEIDYFEFQAEIPDQVPEKLLRIGERLRQRSRLKVVNASSKAQLLKRAKEIFILLDEAFEEIYGSVPTTEKQIEYYTKKYAMFLDHRLVKIVEDPEGELAGFMISMPNLSRAMQKAGGRLLPFGWYHLMRGLKQREKLDFYLAGVKKKYRGLGVDLLMVLELAKSSRAMGFRTTESNPELETNEKIQAQWKFFNPKIARRRRIYKKNILTAE